MRSYQRKGVRWVQINVALCHAAFPGFAIRKHRSISFAAAAPLSFNEDLHSRHTGGTLSKLYDYVFQLPLRLQ
jgi:hypothetical protein